MLRLYHKSLFPISYSFLIGSLRKKEGWLNTRRYCIFFLLLLCSLSKAFAVQDSCHYALKGNVLDADTKSPLAYVSIRVKDDNKFTVSNLKGEFLIQGLCHMKHTLIFSYVGYEEVIYECQYGEVLSIDLKKSIQMLDAITISTEKINDEASLLPSQTLEKDELLTDPTQSLASAISKIEGVQMISTGNNIQLPLIHGLYGNKILILNNGIPHGFQNWGTDHAPEIDLSTVHSIRVLKGSSGVRYGPEALGGAIITHANPLYLNEPFQLNISSGYQSNGRGHHWSANAGQGFQKWSFYLGTNYLQIGDKQTPDYFLTNSGKEEKSAHLGVRYLFKDIDLKFYYSFTDQTFALLRSSVAESSNSFIRAIHSDRPIIIQPFSYAINEPRQHLQHHFGKADINWKYADHAELNLRIGMQFNKREEYDVRRNSHKPIIDLSLMTTNYQLEWKHPDIKNINGTIGIHILSQDNNNNPGTGTTHFIPNYNTLRYSGFIIENLSINKHSFEAGFRIDHEYNNVRGRTTEQGLFRDSYIFSNLSTSLGYVFRLSESHTFRLNFGSAWRLPNMAELYSFGQHGFKTSFGLLRYYNDEADEQLHTDQVLKIKDSNVVPEKGYKWIGEWTLQKQKHALSFTAYLHYIDHFIFNRPITISYGIRGPNPAYIFDQTDTFFAGVDLVWQKNWSDQVSGTLGMNYLWSKNIKKNEHLIHQPPIRVRYDLYWKIPEFRKIPSSKLSLQTSYTFRQFQSPKVIAPENLIDGSVAITPYSEIFDFKAAPDGYFLLNAVWTFELDKFKVNIAANNLLNTSYRDYLNAMRYFADEPGRNFIITIHYMFNFNSNKK